MIVELDAAETHGLRAAVLRVGTPTTEVRFDGDDDADTFHLGATAEGHLVATSSWLRRPAPWAPGEPAYQLRGMATADHVRCAGHGSALLTAGCRRAAALGALAVWARGRDSALDFYLGHGFEVIGEGFIDEPTQLPHHLLRRSLVSEPALIPVIDIGGDEATAGAAIAAAAEQVGFLTVVGHGVPWRVVDGMWSTATAFFDLPTEAKAEVLMPSPGYPYGYTPVAGETLARSLGQETPPDLKESFAIGPIDAPSGAIGGDEAWAFSPNLWPSAAPDLRPAWEAYYRSVSAVAARLLRLMAIGLHLDPNHFTTMIDRHPSAMRALNYPALSGPPPAGQLRAGAHTDYGTLTILLQDDAPGGLQVEHPARSWIDVPAIGGAFVVNLGDALARWTNDRWRSTLHRVVLPPEELAATARRQSVAFFHNANWDATIECLPGCCPAGEAPRYPPIAAGPHLMGKFHSTVLPY